MNNHTTETKKIILIECDYGQAFFDGDTLIKYVHENDARIRPEYHRSLFTHFGISLEVLNYPTSAQKKAIKKYEE